MKPMEIEGAWIDTPRIHVDDRGGLHEWFREGEFHAATGRGLRLSQANFSVSRRGTLRGIHFADVPPGQGKYVKCVRGAVLDVVVDIRVGSPGFGRWELVRLDDEEHRGVFVSEGLGHGLLALTDDATVIYLCSEGYNPTREHGVHPLDPALGIAWPDGVEPFLSPKDTAAPTLAEARDRGLLPSYEECVTFYASGPGIG
ncbi:dTDP-4-dehydrorhamnose 3,5-epimerase [Streptosporangium sp. NPDC023615]|uniref:dTDP-4-dehydrorhamnose 3,5-epimerase family protein n=1 Tax=Streptosporangium sp. NPDC023615 TaxID=3154794 RepID=UPI003423698B